MSESPSQRRPVDPTSRAEAERARDRFFTSFAHDRFFTSFAHDRVNFLNFATAPQRMEPQKTDRDHSTIRLTKAAAPLKLNHMVERSLDSTFHALADPTRRGMLATLARGEKSIGELAEPFAMTFAGASKHVKVLEGAGLIARRKVGRTQLCRLNPEPMAQAEQWLRQWERFWTVRLDSLEALIQEVQRK